ncbi:phosphoribosylamine--glycine ligase [Fructobacillus pseudoficulneus]|uniref:Phosphoribosylamine--glycine ligase n=1 Tax=Fructobacillus pseudoficulneus TaxID=220714 RepID=A0A3F3GX32_9LACO|nr:phosphoribosylamine--glycine ligase [Fructobacillus pseudoficulneus]GAP03264.1 phosphoribosylamine--glycine ligase [Fructobacillus pseudoficulneus]SEH43120.1 phosphoribosylamine--glycine ligase [Fructobacillus pseudoficulneus]
MSKVLVIGSGAREHALAQTFLKSPQVDEVLVAPGNDGMQETGLTRLPIDANDIVSLVQAAKDQQVDLTFVGNEDPLILGVVDRFEEAGLKIFGPNAVAAQLEGSKTFAKEILTANEIPTAKAVTVNSRQEAKDAILEFDWPMVFKLDGLALGKGVTIIKDQSSADEYLQSLYQKDPTAKLVIEEFLNGVEFSIFSLVGKDGQVVHAPMAQDHKRRYDHDRGPNTGGMGAYSPLSWLRDSDAVQTVDELVDPMLAAMADRGTPFTGVLYTGVMLTAAGPKVIEFNVRFGDPEAQVVLPQLESDFYQMILDLLAGKRPEANWQTDDVYLGVVLAAPGYPQAPEKGGQVPSAADLSPLTVNYAGAKATDEGLVANGGRVATVIAHAQDTQAAQAAVYDVLDKTYGDLVYRHDIGHWAVDLGKE